MIFLQLVSELSVEDLGELVYAWELPGVAGNAWNGEPGRSIVISSCCIWDKFIFLATRRPRDCMEMLLECLRNPRRRLGIITVERKTTVGYGEETLACNNSVRNALYECRSEDVMFID
eukprot:Gb_41405 [translate_table: standard]